MDLDLYRIRRDLQHYGADFDNPKVDQLKAGTEAQCVDEIWAPPGQAPGTDHNYFLLEWVEGDSEVCGWVRVYNYEELDAIAEWIPE